VIRTNQTQWLVRIKRFTIRR